MTSQTGKQKMTICILPKIWTSKDNQKIKFRQLIKYNVRNNFLKNHVGNEAERLVLELFFVLKEFYMKKKQVISTSISIYFGSPWLGHTTKNCILNFRLLIHRCSQFWFYKKGLEIVSQSHFADDFSRKLLTTVRCLVPLLPEILDNMYIVITCFQARNVIKLF